MKTTNDTKHTQGPWIYTKEDEGNNWSINGRHQVDGFHSPQDCKLATVYSVEANARLIAAAPDLLAALEAFNLAVLVNRQNLSKEMSEAIGLARAAIAKARATEGTK